MEALVTLVVFIALALIGFPVAISLGLSSVLFAVLLDIPHTIIAQTLFTSIDNFSYIAIPMFMLVGNLMNTGGLSRRIVRFASSLLKKLPGSLGSIHIVACAFFGAISGSASATTAAIGGMLVPDMIEKSYPRGYSGALSAVSGTLGAIIPPSIVMIIYAVAAEVSVTDMFMAGFLPGIIVALGLILTNTIYTMRNGIDVADKDAKISFREVRETFWDAKWALLTPVIILGGVYSGYFTATECSVIACVYALVVGRFIHKEITWKDLLEVLIKTCKTVGAVLFIIPTAIALSKLLTISMLPQQISNWILSVTNNPSMILLFVVLLVFIAGMFMDSGPIILIVTPLFLPMLKSLGVSPIHFGIVLTLGSMMAAVTPPVGVNLFIGQGIAKADTVSIMKYAGMFIAIFMGMFVLITLNPWISTVVVNLLTK